MEGSVLLISHLFYGKFNDYKRNKYCSGVLTYLINLDPSLSKYFYK